MGKVISERYEELEQLGHGGQGVVYKVRHIKHKTVLALKALPSYFLANPTTIGRLEQEALVLTRLRHRNIVQVVGSGRDEALGMIYIVMEYVEGKTLKEYIQEKGSLPLSEVLEITRQVGNALAYAHAQIPPVIHRDIKPSNIIIEDFSGRVVLLDFGIAKELSESTDSHTRTGYMVGTWKYSSPEQLRHEPLTGSADIYSLGMVMYEMYTGVPFFSGRDEPSILGKILHDPHEYELSFPQAPLPAFVEVVQKAVAKSRDKRYASMADFLRDVDTCWSLLDETRIVGRDDSLLTRPPLFQDLADGEMTAVQQIDLDRTVIASQQDDRDIETIDAEIRKLQEERQQRFVLSLQARVKEVREKAEQAGAQQWAEAQFTQGVTHEEQASTLFRDAQYPEAQKIFESALVSFTQAYEETVRAKLRSRAEQARREVEVAKSDADRQGAPEHAPEAYARAQECVTEAETQFKQEAYDEALKRYADARNSFEDARDLAYREKRREEANAARLEASTAREAAFGEGADTLAMSIVEEARRNEQQAAAALEREEFTQARMLYLAASQKYEQAQRRAHSEHLQRDVARAAQAAEEARKRALTSGEAVEAQLLYQQAREAQTRAAALRDAREYEKATQEYDNARRGYDEAATAFLATFRQRAEDAQQRTLRARTQAQQAQAEEHAPDVYQRALGLLTQADECIATGSYQDAIQRYEDARVVFVEAHEFVVSQRAREQEEQRQRAQERKQHTTATRTAAEEAEARIYAQDAYRHALQEERSGDEALAAAQWQGAEDHFTRAQEQFAVALAGARQRKEASDNAEQAKQRVLLIRDEVPIAQATALFPERVAEGQALEVAAEQALRRADFTGAQRAFTQAAELFLQLRHNVNAHMEQARTIDEPTRIAERPATLGANVTRVPVVAEDTVPPVSEPSLSEKTAEKGQETEVATVMISPPSTPVVAREQVVTPAVEHPLSTQTSVHFPPRPSALPARPAQKYVILGAALLAVIAGLYMAHVVAREEASSPPEIAKTTPPVTPAPPVSVAPPEVSPPPPVPPGPTQPETHISPVESSADKQTETTPGKDLEKTLLPPSPTPVALAKLVDPRPALENTVIINEGGKQSFAIAVNPGGGKSLRYDWYIGETKLKANSENRWTYTPGYDEGSETAKTITVVLRDGEKELDRKSWTNVFVKHQPRAPKIVTLSPQSGKPIEAAFGEELSFAIEVNDPDNVAGQPTWFLNNARVGQGMSQRVRVPASGATHIVTVSFADGAGGKVVAPEWNIVVPAALQPSLVDVRPRGETITTQAGRAVEFSAAVELPVRLQGKTKPQLEWSVDGTVRQSKESRQFRFLEEREGSYVVTVVGISRDGVRGTPKQWTVSVRPFEPPVTGGARAELTKDDVRDWIDRYRRAIEQKDGKMLEQLGLDKAEIRERIEDVKRHEDLVIKIDVQEQDIQLDGQPAKRARVSFTRRDIRDGVQTAPGVVRYTLEKQSSGRVVVAR